MPHITPTSTAARRAALADQGHTIQLIRIRRRQSQSEAAFELGLKLQTYQQYERGRRACPARVRETFRRLWGLDLGDGACPHCGRPW